MRNKNNEKNRRRKIGPVQKKILLLLFSGFALTFNRSPKGQRRIIKGIYTAWKDINERELKLAIKRLYESKLVSKVKNSDKTVSFVLSEGGKKIVLTYNIDKIKIQKTKWDGKWRIVTFDIPEKLKPVREDIREYLKKFGFREFQRSTFIIPFECRKEVEYLVEFFNIRRYVRYMEVGYIDNELDIKHEFRLP